MSEPRKGLRVWILDDEPDLAVTCARLVRRAGHVPLVSPTGQQALEVIEREPPDVILTDLRLPAVDGLEILRRARHGGRKIPVVLKEIASALGISLPTMKRHLENILRKLHVRNRVEAALCVARRGDCPHAIGERKKAA